MISVLQSQWFDSQLGGGRLRSISENSLAKQLQDIHKISGKMLKLLESADYFQISSSVYFHTNYEHADLKKCLI